MGQLPRVEDGDYGYHPSASIAVELAQGEGFDVALLIGSHAPDLHDHVGEVRALPSPEVTLPPGSYWFLAEGVRQLMVVTDPAHPGEPQTLPAEEAEPDHPLAHARAWLETWWDTAARQPGAVFAIGDEVIVLPGGQDGVVRRRRIVAGAWSYDVRVAGRSLSVLEGALQPRPVDDDPWEWIQKPAEPADGLAATLTRAKLRCRLSDTVFSFRATRTTFRPYQFKPILKFLQTGALRLLIADEVGLGKTIEAGLLWTELEARGLAGRVLILSPSNLVSKWKLEMEDRFGFLVQELDGPGLREFSQRVQDDKLSSRGAYICSIERMRVWDHLDLVTDLRLQFDLVIVDESHAFRNAATRSNHLGRVISEWARHLIFLSATPLNLHQKDLFNLLDLLSPGEFEDAPALEQRLEPNAILNRVSASFFNPEVGNEQRRAWLRELDDVTFGRVVKQRQEFRRLQELLRADHATAADIARAKRLINELSALSTSVTRTRKVEVQDQMPVRDPRSVEVEWADAEWAFYRAYFQWCVDRAKLAKAPLAFSMQMPLRLVSTCISAARDDVIGWKPGKVKLTQPDEFGIAVLTEPLSESAQLPPHPELVVAAKALGDVDTKVGLLQTEIRKLVAQQQQGLVFTFSKKTLAHLRRRLTGIARVAVLSGDVPKQQRGEIMADFRDGAYDVVLANRVASEGLDFEFCSMVINYDLPWNPMEIEQRIGRIDRIGQKSEKIHVINFHTPGTIESDIVQRVMDRIGVFTSSIGELGPIVVKKITDIYRDAFDFTLSDSERFRRTEEQLAALEERRMAKDDLESAAPMLAASEGMEIEGFENDILRRGGYMGQRELALLVQDWIRLSAGASGTVSTDGRLLMIRGTSEMAHQVQELAVTRERSAREVQDLVQILRDGENLPISLDQELSRKKGPELLTANHPLVRAALAVAAHRQVRHSSVRIDGRGELAPGRYLVQLAVARWQGLQPRSEVWSAVANLETHFLAPDAVGDALLARLADAGLDDGGHTLLDDLEASLTATDTVLRHRQVEQREIRSQDNGALLDARRIGAKEVHARRRASIEKRRATLLERGNHRMAELVDAQLRKEHLREREALEVIDAAGACDLQLEPLAVVTVEVAQ